jgi:hypothetical protein
MAAGEEWLFADRQQTDLATAGRENDKTGHRLALGVPVRLWQTLIARVLVLVLIVARFGLCADPPPIEPSCGPRLLLPGVLSATNDRQVLGLRSHLSPLSPILSVAPVFCRSVGLTCAGCRSCRVRGQPSLLE